MQVLGTGCGKTGSNALDVCAELPEELFVGELLFLNGSSVFSGEVLGSAG